MPPLPRAYNANSLASRLSQVRSILGITSQVSSARGVDGTGSDEKCTQTAVTQVGFDPVIPELDGLEIMQSSSLRVFMKLGSPSNSVVAY
jgi:hypothetical protein